MDFDISLNKFASPHARVLSGMRPAGQLHLGHYHGVLKNWVRLQHEYRCFFFVADWHALTTHYDDPTGIPQSTHEMVIDWLAAGVNPNEATIFIQSRVPEHAELHLLLSMITPLGWLERVPSYKDQQEKLKERDLATYGFLGYPLLQSADILLYRAGLVPVGEDQVSHVELTREVARRFNHIYGRETDFAAKAEAAMRKMGKKNARLYQRYRNAWQERGDDEALRAGRALLEGQRNITVADKDRLYRCAPMPMSSASNCAPCRRIRRVCAARIPVIRQNVRCGNSTRSILTKTGVTGCSRGVNPPLSVVLTANSRSSMLCSRSCALCRSASGSSRSSRMWCTTSLMKGVKPRGKRRVRPWISSGM